MKKNGKKLTALLLVLAMLMSIATIGVSAAEVTAEEQNAGASSGVTGDCTWTLDDQGKLTISGNGAMGDCSREYDFNKGKWYTTAKWGVGIKSIVIESGVTSIGNSAFSGCTNLTSVKIGNSVTSIGDYAFDYCTGLTSIAIPNSVTSIGNFAFNSCTGLTSVTIPDSVTSIGDYAFYNCTGLTSVTIPNSVTSIGGSAFSDTAWYDNQPDGLIYAGKVAYQYKGEMPDNTSITIKDGTKEITDGAFEDCTSLTSVTIPDSVTSIGTAAFLNCTGLTSVTIPNSVTSIGSFAFSSCSGLTSVTIPDSVTSIVEYAFCGCTGLKSVTIPDSVTYIGEKAFGYYFDDQFEIKTETDFTIYGKKGSSAQQYADENGFTFIPLEDEPVETIGDVSGDSKVDVTDATLIQMFAAEFTNLNATQQKAADTNHDGKVDVTDATMIQMYAAEIIDHF